MIIKKLYSNVINFKEMNFSNGFNLIVGGKLDEVGNSDRQHNVGKTISIELIDFCLLADFNTEKKLHHFQQELLKYTFFLLIQLEENSFITISRSIEFPNVFKYKEHKEEETFLNTDDFTERTVQDGKEIFSLILSNNYQYDINFRKYVKRFIRYSDQYINSLNIEANKDYQKKDIDWIPGLMNTLCFDYDKTYDYYNSKQNVKKNKDKITNFKKAFDISCKKTTLQKKIDKFDSEIAQKNKILKSNEKEIKSFNFNNADKELINNSLIEINEKLEPLNKESFYIQKKIKNLKKALEINFEYNIDENLYKFFKEVKLVFNNEIKKSFDGLLKFNQVLLEERKTIATDQLKKLSIRFNVVKDMIKLLNEKKKEKLEILNQTDFQKKFYSVNQELDALKKEIFKIEGEQEKYKKILNIVVEQEEDEELQEKAFEYYQTKRISSYDMLKKIRAMLKSKLESSIHESVLLEFNEKKPSIDLKDEKGNSVIAGSTHTKIISIYFDLILSHNLKSVFNIKVSPVVHDNIFTDMQSEYKIKMVELIKELIIEDSVQYIFTDFKDSLPKEVLDMVENKTINLVNELYITENGYNETLFRKNLTEEEASSNFLDELF